MDHIHTFLTTQDMEDLPRWEISSIPGPPLRQHKHERRYISGTHSFIPTRRIRNDDYGGQMIFGDLVGLKLRDICVTNKNGRGSEQHLPKTDESIVRPADKCR